ncbi:hypothetical protein KFE25_013388 [Diacronema lutheri]|uniref:C2 domain-containing protein n=1 Tax=Diacronema lutheri TaxID=2081491 RepID=A0A8J6CFS2_DIALT|nr:hypothetical protein KFE25_013388 [Diacronema lutheri]
MAERRARRRGEQSAESVEVAETAGVTAVEQAAPVGGGRASRRQQRAIPSAVAADEASDTAGELSDAPGGGGRASRRRRAPTAETDVAISRAPEEPHDDGADEDSPSRAASSRRRRARPPPPDALPEGADGMETRSDAALSPAAGRRGARGARRSIFSRTRSTAAAAAAAGEGEGGAAPPDGRRASLFARLRRGRSDGSDAGAPAAAGDGEQPRRLLSAESTEPGRVVQTDARAQDEAERELYTNWRQLLTAGALSERRASVLAPGATPLDAAALARSAAREQRATLVAGSTGMADEGFFVEQPPLISEQQISLLLARLSAGARAAGAGSGAADRQAPLAAGKRGARGARGAPADARERGGEESADEGAYDEAREPAPGSAATCTSLLSAPVLARPALPLPPIQPDPLRPGAGRPFFVDWAAASTPDAAARLTRVQPPRVGALDAPDGGRARHGAIELVVHVRGLHLSDHRLFSAEMLAAARVHAAYQTWFTHVAQRDAAKLGARIGVLRDECEAAEAQLGDAARDAPPSARRRGAAEPAAGVPEGAALADIDDASRRAARVQQLSALYAELLQALASRDEAEYEARVLARRALVEWAALKATRARADCTTTSVMLRVRQTPANARDDEAARAEAAELELLAHRRAHALRASLVVAARARDGRADGDGVASVRADAMEVAAFDERAVASAVSARQAFCLRPVGEAALSLRLSHSDAVLTPVEQLSKEERQRQRLLAAVAIGGTLRVNGHVAGTLAPRPLHAAELRVHFGDVLVVELAHPAQSVVLQLTEQKAFALRPAVVGEVPLAAPADAAAGYASETEPYAFCAHTTFVRAQADIPTDPPPPSAAPPPPRAADGGGGADARAARRRSSASAPLLADAPSARAPGSGGDGGTIEVASAAVGCVSGYVEASVAWEAVGALPLRPGARADGASRASAAGAQPRGASCASGRAGAASITAGGLLNAAHVFNWLSATALDPNDPRDARLIRTLRTTGSKLGASRAFRATRLEDDAAWARAADAPGPDRQQPAGALRAALLRLRSMRPALFGAPVPARDGLVPAEMAALVAPARAGADDDEGTAPRADGSDDFVAFSGYRKVATFLKRVERARAARAGRGRPPRAVREVVLEPADRTTAPVCACNVGGLVALFQPRRPLRPSRKPRVPDYETTDRSLIIGIKRAGGLPVRARSTRAALGVSDELRPYWLCSLGGRTVRTTSKAGTSPQWNEALELALPITSAQLEARELASTSLTLYCALFDEAVRTHGTGADGGSGAVAAAAGSRAGAERAGASARLLAPGGRPDGEGEATDAGEAAIATIRRSQALREPPGMRVDARRYYLGTLAIPLSTILSEGRVEGTFEIDVPPMLLGHRLPGDADEAEQPARGQGLRTPARAARRALAIGAAAAAAAPAAAAARAVVTLFVTIDPVLPPPTREVAEVPDLDDAPLLAIARTFIGAIRALAPFASGARPLQLFALSSRGESTLVCRYVHPQAPPAELRLVSELMRYVRLIPFLEDVVTSVEAKADVWTTTDEFLSMGAGDGEEHALLLCNYLLHRGDEAYVVVGRSALEERAFFVLMRETGAAEGTLFHAVRGTSYPLVDSRCPLSAVGMVFNASNVWANVQPADVPSKMSWNLADSLAWRRLFIDGSADADQVSRWTRSVQLSTPHYTRAAEEDKNDLEREVERAIRLHIEERRGSRPTDWNNNMRRILKTILVRLEVDAREGVTSKPDELRAELAQTLQSYAVVGFPLNVTWTDIKQVIEAVDATDIHNSSGKELKFALTVHVVAYPNSIYSVWVYVAALTSLR